MLEFSKLKTFMYGIYKIMPGIITKNNENEI
jgi:hypothetical protein